MSHGLHIFIRVETGWVTFTSGLPETVERKTIVIAMDMLRVCGPSALTVPSMTARTRTTTKAVPVRWLLPSATVPRIPIQAWLVVSFKILLFMNVDSFRTEHIRLLFGCFKNDRLNIVVS